MNTQDQALINKATKDLTKEDIQVLKEHFVHLYKREVPKRVSTTFLHGNVAWGLQAIEQGHDPIQLREKIYKQFKTLNTKKNTKIEPSTGTQILREWKGQTYRVTKVKEGYRYNDELFKTLTPIAKKITNSHISGPRFFGLTKQSHE